MFTDTVTTYAGTGTNGYADGYVVALFLLGSLFKKTSFIGL
jgi:NAD(P)H-hydrate repair Nnr-like enzyme with NAD(P)H-hydrate epimerase domain